MKTVLHEHMGGADRLISKKAQSLRMHIGLLLLLSVAYGPYCSILATEIPVQVGGITVRLCDLLHGDRNGVTPIPREIAKELPDVCAEYMRAEDAVLNYLN